MKHFNNIQNKSITDYDGKTHWLSRSVALAGVVVVSCGEDLYILTEKRSSIMEQPDKWAVVSGYLDYNETLLEAIKREIYEETTFNVDQYEDNLKYYSKQPFHIKSDSSGDAKQNVTLSYVFLYRFSQMPLEIESYTNDEVSEVKWMKIEDFWMDESKIDWAFNHNIKIKLALQEIIHKLN